MFSVFSCLLNAQSSLAKEPRNAELQNLWGNWGKLRSKPWQMLIRAPVINIDYGCEWCLEAADCSSRQVLHTFVLCWSLIQSIPKLEGNFISELIMHFGDITFLCLVLGVRIYLQLWFDLSRPENLQHAAAASPCYHCKTSVHMSFNCYFSRCVPDYV